VVLGCSGLFLPRIEDLPRCVPTEEQPTLPIGSAGGAAAGTLTVDDPGGVPGQPPLDHLERSGARD
jgi:hypothetical protein